MVTTTDLAVSLPELLDTLADRAERLGIARASIAGARRGQPRWVQLHRDADDLAADVVALRAAVLDRTAGVL